MAWLSNVNRSAVIVEVVLSNPSSNPYYVSASPEGADGDFSSTETTSGQPESFDPDLISSTGMVIDTIRMTTLAGASFGLLVTGVFFLIATLRAVSRLDMNEWFIVEFLTMGFFSLLVGGFLAFCFSVMASLCLVGMTGTARGPSRQWDPPTMRLVHAGTGFASGWLSTLVLGLLAQSVPPAAAIGLIPALYGGIFTTMMGERKIRRALGRQKILLGEALQETSVSPLSAMDARTRRTPNVDPPGRS